MEKRFVELVMSWILFANSRENKDFFSRAITDMNCLCGNYERETAEMFIKAFANGELVNDNR